MRKELLSEELATRRNCLYGPNRQALANSTRFHGDRFVSTEISWGYHVTHTGFM